MEEGGLSAFWVSEALCPYVVAAGWVRWWPMEGGEETKGGIPSIRPAQNVHGSLGFFSTNTPGEHAPDVPLYLLGSGAVAAS